MTKGSRSERRCCGKGERSSALALPQVQRVLDVVETDSGSVYLVLERLPASTLDGFIWDDRLDEDMAIDISRQLARILIHLHARGVVHRDLRNGAIHVAEEGGRFVVKLTSFVIATIAGEPRLTPRGMPIGHPAWVAPEQLRGEESDPRSDLFALGVVLFTMLAGRLPFDEARASAEPRHLPLRPKSHAASLDGICLKLLSSDPQARYQNAEALLAALEEIAPSSRHAAGPAKSLEAS